MTSERFSGESFLKDETRFFISSDDDSLVFSEFSPVIRYSTVVPRAFAIFTAISAFGTEL